jgi:hypothetical protein
MGALQHYELNCFVPKDRLSDRSVKRLRGLASLSGVFHMLPRPARRMPFWEQPTPALANWRSLGEAISLNENRPAVNRAACLRGGAAPSDVTSPSNQKTTTT